MEEITMYRAEDGTYFEEEEDCAKYEATQTLAPYFAEDEIIILDAHKNLICLDSAIDDNFDRIAYVYCATDESAEALNKIFELMDTYQDPFEYHNVEKGFYAWEEYNEEWHVLEEDMKAFSNRWDWISQVPHKKDTVITQFRVELYIN